MTGDDTTPAPFWSLPADELWRELGTDGKGLRSEEVLARRRRFGANVLADRPRSDAPAVLLRQFTSPIILILIAASVLSFALHDPVDAMIILGIVVVSGALGFWQEHGAAAAVDRLLKLVELKATVVRDGKEIEIPSDELVPGDLLLLSAGSGVQADCRLIQSHDLYVDEAALTGEGFPAEKQPGILQADTPLAQRTNALYLGTHVVSGSARAVVVRTGRETEFGSISHHLRMRPSLSEFEIGIRSFGYLLLEITLMMVIAIFAFNVLLHRPVLDSFLFALALAVGLTPQLLPAIISTNLSRGARRMAEQKVIVKRLAAIENFGSMDILCSDKTGTLTEGRVHLHSAIDMEGSESERVLFHAWLNATFETAFGNPIDEAIRNHRSFEPDGWHKLDEIPYDFIRKRLSVLVERQGNALLITKGAMHKVLDVCAVAERTDGSVMPLPDALPTIERKYAELSAEGYRTLGVAIRAMEEAAPISHGSESGMTFLGLLALDDPPKAGITETVRRLASLGVHLKVITGDNELVAAHVGMQLGLDSPRLLTGEKLRQLSDTALPVRAQQTDIFAEIEPNQKERIVRALRKAGHVVGYIGDGINDAPALHAADVSISVQSAVDVAKEAADIVLLEHDLAVLEAGVREGRRTFGNTLKYVFMATSANFGNMFSMAGASLFLPFLPLLPKQILLTNLLTDLPEMTIATDRVDAGWIDRPRRWNLDFIRRFMIVFGLVSSFFDYLTFGILLLLLNADADQFRTGWFVESVVSAALIVLVVRSRAPFFRSRPSAPLLWATLLVVAATIVLPYTPAGAIFGLVPLPAPFLGLMALIVILYIASAELAKWWFYRSMKRRRM
jgi:Mg2+-importing ATPase